MSLEIGSLYYRYPFSRLSAIRRVIGFEDKKVLYETVRNFSKKAKAIDKCNISNFKKKFRLIDEDFRRRNTRYIILDNNGFPFITFRWQTVVRYLKYDRLIKVEEDIYQFKDDGFVEKMKSYYGVDELPKWLAIRYNRCNVCGCTDDGHEIFMTRHHIVPVRKLDLIPIEEKEKFWNIIPLCRECHTTYEAHLYVEKLDYDTPQEWYDDFLSYMNPQFLDPSFKFYYR